MVRRGRPAFAIALLTIAAENHPEQELKLLLNSRRRMLPIMWYLYITENLNGATTQELQPTWKGVSKNTTSVKVGDTQAATVLESLFTQRHFRPECRLNTESSR